jgi:hypothetical protein
MTDVRPGLYRHFKGRIYRVLGTARHSETEEVHVVYLARDGSLWIRPAAMFTETVEREGYRGPRFSFVGERPGIDGPAIMEAEGQAVD